MYPQVYSASDDELLGTVEQEWTCWDYQFMVRDQRGGAPSGSVAEAAAGSVAVPRQHFL